jgi:UrcA family protein
MYSARVPYGDLNLASDAAQNALQQRISLAATTVCNTAGPANLQFLRVDSECRDGAIASAQPAFNDAVAAARHGSVIIGAGAALTVSARH